MCTKANKTTKRFTDFVKRFVRDSVGTNQIQFYHFCKTLLINDNNIVLQIYTDI